MTINALQKNSEYPQQNYSAALKKNFSYTQTYDLFFLLLIQQARIMLSIKMA